MAITFTRKKLDSTSVGDWPIQKLFYHICPDLKNPRNHYLCEKVGLKIMDNLPMAQLKIWGRVIGSLGTPLELIDPSYWSHAEFNYMFLGNDERLNEITSTRLRMGPEYTGRPQYRDLQVNRREALTIRPMLQRVLYILNSRIREIWSAYLGRDNDSRDS